MSSGKDMNNASKAKAAGACFFLEKPVSLEDLKYVWQYVYRRKTNPMKGFWKAVDDEEKANRGKESWGIRIVETGNVSRYDDSDPKGKNKKTSEENKKRPNEDKQSEREEKKSKTVSEQVTFEGKNPKNGEGNDEKEESNSFTGSKSRAVWSHELHLKFTAALSELGDKNGRPKAILKLMDVPNLTQRQVSSHLQKYKTQVNRISEAGSASFPSVSRLSNPYKTAEYQQQLEGKGKSVFQIGQGPDFGTRGQNFGSHEFRTLNHNTRYAGMSAKSIEHSHSYPIDNCFKHQEESYEELQRSNLVWSSLQVPELNISVTAEVAPPNISVALQFLNGPADPHQELKCTVNLTTPFSSQNQYHFPTAFTETSKEPDFVPGNMISGNALCSNNASTDFTNGTKGLGAIQGQAPPVSSVNQDEHQREQADILRFLEEEQNDLQGVCNEPNPLDVDQYCEWLNDVLLGNRP